MEKKYFSYIQSVFDNSPNIKFIKDTDRKYVVVNKAFCSIYQRTAEEIIGKTDEEFEFLSDLAEGFKNEDEKIISSRETIVSEATLLSLHNRKDSWYRVVKSPLIDDNGEVYGILGVANDISDKINYQSKLKQRESFLNEILESPKDLIVFSLDPNYCYKAFNSNHKRTMKAIWGVDIKEKRSMLHYIKKEQDREKAKANFDRALSGEEFTLEEEYGDKSLQRSYYENFYCPNKSESGEVNGLTVFVRDITEQRKEQKKFRQRRRLLDLIYNTVTDAIALFEVKNDSLYYVSCNKAYLDVLKPYGVVLNESDLVGQDAFKNALENSFYTKREAEEAIERNMKVIKSKKPMSYTEATTSPKGMVYIDSTLSPIMSDDGEVKYILFRGKNFSDIMQSNKKLQEHEMLLESINQNVQDGIYRSTPDAVFRYTNHGMESLFGYTRKEFEKVSPASLYYLKEERKSIIDKLRADGYFENREIQLVKKNGEVFWARLSCTLSLKSDGTEIIDGIIVDVTKDKKMKEKLSSMNAHLSKTNDELDHLVYRTSHDLRSPIASLLGLSELMKFEPLNESQTEYLSLMEDQLHKLDKIILDIINYRKIATAGLQKQEIDFEGMCNDILKGVGFIENFKNINCQVEISGDHPFISDAHNIQIILNNLLSNAIKYSKRDIDDAFVKLSVSISSEKAIIEIEDNGIGIEAEYLDHIFNMFYRATAYNTGTGLGLFIVKQAVSKLDGSISVSSTFDSGTKFELEIPNLLNSHSI